MSQTTAAAGGDDPRWRIDELAQMAGVTVDAVRFYERRSLLPDPHRQGRAKRYSGRHLARLVQIRRLQEKGFSVNGIAVLLQAEPATVDTLLGADEAEGLDRAELAARAGVAEEWLAGLEDARLLTAPAAVGRAGYDAADLRMVTAVRQLVELGHPPEAVMRLLRTYVEALEPMERQAFSFMSAPRPSGTGGLAADPATTAAHSYRLTEEILGYLHRRIGQRLTVERLEAESEAAAARPDGPVDSG